MFDYFGKGRLSKNADGFSFVENSKVIRVRNRRIAKIGEGTFIMYETKTGKFKIQIMLDNLDLKNGDTVKVVSELTKQMLLQAEEEGLL